MKLTFVNSAFVNAPEAVVLAPGRWRNIRHLRVRYGIFEHPDRGPVLIDTGYSTEVTEGPTRSLALRCYSRVLKPRLLESGEIETVLHGMGYAPKDVATVIITHFHADHVSALRRFPQADVITDMATLTGLLCRSRIVNLRKGVFPELLPADLSTRTISVSAMPEAPAPLNLGTGRDIFGDGSIIAVDLPGHAVGHFGLCFPKTDPALLYACDVQWANAALSQPYAPPLLARLVSENRRASMISSLKVTEFAAAGGRVVLCHDPALTPYDLEQPEDA